MVRTGGSDEFYEQDWDKEPLLIFFFKSFGLEKQVFLGGGQVMGICKVQNGNDNDACGWEDWEREKRRFSPGNCVAGEGAV